MCPASTSTATPSGILRPLVTIACRLEPSGLSDIMRLPLTSRKNRCPEVGFGPCSAIFDLGTVVEDIDFDSSFLKSDRPFLSNELHEGAETSDSFADNESVHFSRPLIRVQGLGIGKETGDLMVEPDAVAAESLPRPSHRLTHSHGAKGLRQRRMVILQLAFVLHLGEPDNHALRRSDVSQHPGQQVLHELETCDGLAELFTSLGVSESVLICPHRTPH